MAAEDTGGARWKSYESRVLPADADETQRLETRRAFYAGAWHLLQVMIRLGEDDVTEDAGTLAVSRLEGELEEFVRDVLRGDY
jgi:hypothetical protein